MKRKKSLDTVISKWLDKYMLRRHAQTRTAHPFFELKQPKNDKTMDHLKQKYTTDIVKS